MVKAKPKKRGRKTIGQQPREVFSVRLDPVLRKQLEASAKERGKNVSQEIDHLLKEALAINAKREDAQLRTLAFLIEEAAELVGPLWSIENWSFEAFKAAASTLVEKFRPSRENPPYIDGLSPGARAFKDMFAPSTDSKTIDELGPEKLGELMAALLWRSVLTIDRPPPGTTAERGSWFFSMPQARETLGLQAEMQEQQIDEQLNLFQLTVQYSDQQNLRMAEQMIADAQLMILAIGDKDPEFKAHLEKTREQASAFLNQEAAKGKRK